MATISGYKKRDFWELRSSGLLRDVSGQRISPIFRDFLTLVEGTDRLSRNVANKLQLLAA